MLAQSLEWLRSPAAILFVFGLVIFVHELGHFLVAKWMGVYAPRFSIGFGRPLWKRRWGETEYVIAVIPLGGYVRMASREDETMAMIEGGGEKPREEPTTVGGSGAQVLPDEPKRRKGRGDDWDPEAMAPFGPKPVPQHRLFESKSLPARLAIMLAGVSMNALLALVLLTGLAFSRPVVRSNVVAEVTAPATAPELRERIAAGDTIRTVNDVPVRHWGDFVEQVLRGEGDRITITTHRETVHIPVDAPGRPSRDDIAAAIQPLVPAVIAEVTPESAARRAGIQPGDSVVAINGEAIRGWTDMVQRVQRSGGRELTIALARDGELLTVTATPDTIRRPGDTVPTGFLGVGPQEVEWIRVPANEAIVQGWRETTALTGLVLTALRDLVTGRASMQQLGGPVRIAEASAEAARSGIQNLLRLTAFISINLAILNLLPIPILDGGQILLNIVESVRGSPLSARAREYLVRFGLATILLIFVIVMFNDLRRLAGRLLGI